MKTANKILDILIIIAIVALFIVNGLKPHYKNGDINHDGSVDITDLVIVNRATLGKVEAIDYSAADMDKNGHITDSDVKAIENIILTK